MAPSTVLIFDDLPPDLEITLKLVASSVIAMRLHPSTWGILLASDMPWGRGLFMGHANAQTLISLCLSGREEVERFEGQEGHECGECSGDGHGVL